MIGALIIFVWLICGFFAYGRTLGHFTDAYPYNRHVAFALSWGFLGGPVSLIITFFTAKGLFRLHALTTDQRWAEYQKRWPSLGRQYFEE